MERRRQYKAWIRCSRVFGDCASRGSRSPAKKLTTGSTGVAQRTRGRRYCELGGLAFQALSGGWTIYNIREYGDRILLGDRHGSDRRRAMISGDGVRRRHGELEAGGNCGIGGNGGAVGIEREASGGGAGGKRGIGGAGVGVSRSICADSRRAAFVCAAGDAVPGSG